MTHAGDEAAREEHEREADARRRLEHIEGEHIEGRASEQPAVALEQVDRDGCQHDFTDSSAYRVTPRPRRGLAR